MTRSLVRLLALPALLLGSLLSIAPVTAQDFVWAPTLAVGSSLPAIDAVDQDGQRHTFADLSGENGLVLVLSRSFDWCPYCIAQLERLVAVEAQFAALGYKVAAMTYDPVATLKQAQEQYGTTFPLLYDEGNTHVMAMGILNTQYSPGQRAYGIPYPGIFVLDAQGVIRAKLAEEDYKLRPEFSLVLEAIAGL